MLRTLRRSFAPHVALVACLVVPVAFASWLGTSTGCTNLLVAGDAGTPGADAGVKSEDGGAPGDTGTTGTTDSAVATVDADDGAPPYDCAVENATFGAPNDLACTGLYSDFTTKTIATTAKAYDPGLDAWNDGATSLHFIFLPPGTKIDTSDMNEWTFPVGTKAWQQLTLSGQIVETRFYWKRGAEDWVRGSYAWSSDGTSATYLPSGQTDVGGGSYSIPTADQCDQCHAGRIDRLLGFEAVSLSQSSASGLDMTALLAGSLLTTPPSAALVIPDDGTGLGAPALGWLHGNCGTSCHNTSPGASAATGGLLLRLEASTGADGGAPTLGAYTETNTYLTTVNVPASLAPFAADGWKRVTPHDTFAIDDAGLPGTSLVPYCAQARNNASVQMPPLASQVADLAGVAVVKDWITNGSFPP
jgi:hypothetical protein